MLFRSDLGELYRLGLGVAASLPTSAEWFRRAAEHGDTIAQYNTGVNLRDGQGVSMNHAEAVRWFQRAAAAGHPQAQEALAAALLYGLGIERNPPQAFDWLQRAAASGAVTAQHQLALLYASGDAGPRDIASALEWIYVAVERSSRQRRQTYQAIADDMAATKLTGRDPVRAGELTMAEIEKGQKDPNYRLVMQKGPDQMRRTKGPR